MSLNVPSENCSSVCHAPCGRGVGIVIRVRTVDELHIVMQYAFSMDQRPALVVLAQSEFVLPSGSVLFFSQFDLYLDVRVPARRKAADRTHAATPPHGLLKTAA